MKKFLSVMLACSMLTVMVGCNESVSKPAETAPLETTTEPTTEIPTETTTEAPTEPPTEKETTAVDALNKDELKMYRMLCDYSDQFLTPSSLRLSSWVKGNVNTELGFQQIGKSVGDEVEYVFVTAQNRMGGNSEGCAFVYSGVLISVDTDYKVLISYLADPSNHLKNPNIHANSSIDKINRALKEYFESKGY